MTATAMTETIALSPHGALFLLPANPDAHDAPLPERIRTAFARGHADGLMQLGLSELSTELPVDLGYWRDFAVLYFGRLSALPALADEAEPRSIELPPPADALTIHATRAPPMVGGEYLDARVLETLWTELHQTVQASLAQHNNSVRGLFAQRGSAWNLVGRVCFHLAERKSDSELPFAFLATYSDRLSAKGKAQHLPLGRALKEYAGAKNQAQLLQLLLPVHKGAESSVLLRGLVDSGDVFHASGWNGKSSRPQR